jgi:integrase
MAKGWRSYATKALGKHIWSGDKIFLAASAKAHTKTQHRTYEIEARAFGLQRGGWLEAAVDSAPNPMATPDATAVARFIVQLASNPTYCSYLNKPVTLLQREDIIALFEGVDATVGDTGSNAADQYSQRVRHFLSRPTEPLATGDLIRDVRYYTSLKTPVPRARDTLSDRPHPNLKESQLAKPASAIEFTDLEDLRTKQVAHFEGRNRVLAELCATVLDSHDFVVESIRAARRIAIHDLDLPRFLRDQIVDKKKIPHYAIQMIQGEALLPVCVYLMDANELFKKPYCIRLPTQKIEAFNPLSSNGGFREQFGILLSERYLSVHVYMACLVILMLETGWNSSTVLSLTPDRIEEIDGKYYLHGYKSKSGQNQQSETNTSGSAVQSTTRRVDPSGLVSKIYEEEDAEKPVEVENPLAARAITLLLTHQSNIDQDWKTENRQLFLLMSLNTKEGNEVFRVADIGRATRRFCDFIGHPRFVIDDLRKQAVNTKYVRTRDLRQAQADLGHANPRSTLTYVNGAALRQSKEAIIKDFGAILSDSYLYAAGKLFVNSEANDRKSRLTRTLLLFPPSSLHAEDGDSIADRWLNSKGTFSFQIGEEEIAYCAYQKKYYRKSCAKLVSENPQRFAKYHLPRILFCEALYRFISQSPLGNKLKDIEGELK